MENDVTIDQDYQLWVLLHQVCVATTRAREKELREVGISRMQATVLFWLKASNKSVTPAELSRLLFREPHTIFGLLNRMEQQGFVKKIKDMERKNLVRVVLTEKGEELWQKSKDMTAMHTIMDSLSLEQREMLRLYLGILRNTALKEIGLQPLSFP